MKLLYTIIFTGLTLIGSSQSDSLNNNKNAIEIELAGPNLIGASVNFNYKLNNSKGEGGLLLRNGIGLQNLSDFRFTVRNGLLYEFLLHSNHSIFIEAYMSHFFYPNGKPSDRESRNQFYEAEGGIYHAPYYARYEFNFGIGIQYQYRFAMSRLWYFSIEPILFNGYRYGINRTNIIFLGISFGKYL